MNISSSEHYYQDGDIIIIVEDTSFRVHKLILGLASPVFKDFCAKRKDIEDLNLTLEQESAVTFSNILSFIYPEKILEIKWENIEEMFRVANKFMMESMINTLFKFLDYEYYKNPLLSIYLANLYGEKKIYKESSKLILDKFPNYFLDPFFNKLNDTIKASLLDRYYRYILAFGKINGLIYKFEHDPYCDTTIHHELFSKSIENIKKKASVAPSELEKIMFQETKIHNCLVKSCNKTFIKDHLPNTFQACFGEFEPLEVEKGKKGASCYIFIEMKD